jgi:hypothetical protein
MLEMKDHHHVFLKKGDMLFHKHHVSPQPNIKDKFQKFIYYFIYLEHTLMLDYIAKP